jgi:hypothetical protein
MERAGGSVNEPLVRKAYEFLRHHEKDGLYIPPSLPGSPNPKGWKTYHDVLPYDEDDWAHSRVLGTSAERRFPNRLTVFYCCKVSAKPSARSKPVWKPALRQGLANAPGRFAFQRPGFPVRRTARGQ